MKKWPLFAVTLNCLFIQPIGRASGLGQAADICTQVLYTRTG